MTTYLDCPDRANCSGCGACVQICPRQCISMSEAPDGFMYPQIDQARCIECGRCRQVCPYASQPEQFSCKAGYAAQAHSQPIKTGSSSGGCFAALAQAILSKHGVVFGAAWTADHGCMHQKAETAEELQPLMGSKYVQSRCDVVYPEVRRALQDGRPVLFAGTPCQIAGVKGYLGKAYDHLLCLDIACHGVPSGADFRRCLEHLEKKHAGKLTYFRFRDKQHAGWNHSFTYRIARNGREKTYTVAPYRVPYYYLFLHARNHRKSCYTCPYVGMERVGDITLADFWRAEQHMQESEIGQGVSAVFCNTEKGLAWWQECQQFLQTRAFEPAVLAVDNQPFLQHSKEPAHRDEMLTDILTHGYDVAKRYISRKEYGIAALKAAIPEDIKRTIRRIRKGGIR